MSGRLLSRARKVSNAMLAGHRGYADMVLLYCGSMGRATPVERLALHSAFEAEFAEAMRDPEFARVASTVTEECMRCPEWVAWMEEHRDDDVTLDSTWEETG